MFKDVTKYLTIHPSGLSVIVIGALIALALVLTKEPTVLLALLIWPVLQSQQVMPPEDVEEDDENPIGFTANIK